MCVHPYVCDVTKCILLSPGIVCSGYVEDGGRDSSVGIATCYGLGGPGIESRWEARFSAPVLTGSEAHPASYTMGTRSYPAGKAAGA